MPVAIALLAVLPGQSVARVTDSVAGFSVHGTTVSQALRHDPKSGFYLSKSVDCDFSHVTVILTRDRRMLGVEVEGGEARDINITQQSLPLTTKNGIKIGMAVNQVEQRIGAPDRVARMGARKEFLCYLYRQIKMEDRENGYALRNTYVFKRGLLIEVQIHGDSIPGCGGDGRDESWWPSGRFGRDSEDG